MGLQARKPRLRAPRILERYLLSLCARPFAARLLVAFACLRLTQADDSEA